MFEIEKNIWECSAGHIILGERDCCAWCDGYEAEWVREVISEMTEWSYYARLGERYVLQDKLGRLHPMDAEDIMNGLYPGYEKPRFPARFLYYMRVQIKGEYYYKIGISHNPMRRFHHYTRKIIMYREFKSEADARQEEKRLLEQVRNDFKHVSKYNIGHGYTEAFGVDVLGLDNES